MNELSYRKNTFYLAASGVLSQVFAALQKIILTRYLKEEGMAIYQSAICVYSVFLTFALGGMPISVTHFISKSRSDKDGIYKVLCFSFYMMCFSGLLLAFLMFTFRAFFGTAMKDAGAAYAIAVLSPSVFAVCVAAAIKACFEGYSNMLPCAIAQVLEALAKLGLAYFLTSFLCVFSAKYAAAGGALAITLGEIFSTCILLVFFAPLLRKIKLKNFRFQSDIMMYALPISLYAVILSSLDLAENAVIRNSLLAIRFSAHQARVFLLKYSPYTSVFDTVTASGRLTLKGSSWLYGAFFGYAMTIVRFFSGLLRTFAIPFFPLASRLFAEKKYDDLENALSRIIRIILFISIPICAALIFFSRQITYVIFGSPIYSQMLAFSAPLLVISPILSAFTALEYGYCRTFVPFLFGFISFMISIPLCFILIRIPQLNILGAALAALSGTAAELLMNLFFIKRRLKIEIHIFRKKRETRPLKLISSF